MPNQQVKATTRMMAATALALPLALGAMGSPAALAQTAGKSQGVSSAAHAEPKSVVQQTVMSAESLAKAGKLVQASNLLSGVLKDPAWDRATESDKQALGSAYVRITKKLASADANDISLEKARIALDDGNLEIAEQHAKAVSTSASAGSKQRTAAEEVMRQVGERREELSPIARQALTQIAADIRDGRYLLAKSSLAGIRRSGVKLSDAESELVASYQLKVLEQEQKAGRAFEAPAVNLGAWQPGVVRRDGGNEQPAPAENAQPAETPAPAQPEAQPATPAPAPMTPPPVPAQDDLIQAAMRADAAARLAEADQLFSEGRNNLALEKYRLVTSAYRQYLTPDQLQYAEAKIAEVQTRLDRGDLKGKTIESISLLLQRTETEFANNMEQARKALDQGDTRQAQDLTAQTRLVINQTRSYMSAQQYADFSAQIEQLNIEIEQARATIDAAERNREAIERAAATEKAEDTRRNERERKINESIDRARALQAEMKYDEALQIIDQILFLDPRNPSGLLLRDAISATRVYEQYSDIMRRKGDANTQLRLDVAEQMLPPKGIMEHPIDWPKKSFDRGEQSAFAETPENRRVLAKIENERLPVNFTDNTLADVVGFLRQVTDLNIDADWASLATVGAREDTTVNLKLSPVPIRVILDRVVRKISSDEFSQAGWAVEDGTLRIASEEELRKNTTLEIYDISDLLFEVENYRTVPQIDLQSLLQQSQGGGGGGTSPFDEDDDEDDEDDEEALQRRRDRINLIREIIVSNVDPNGWKDGGGETGTIQDLGGSFIIRNTPKNHREIVGLLSKLREVRSMQINVETKFLLVNQSWFEQIGFDVDVVLNANNNQVRSAQQVAPGTQAGDFFNFGGSAPGGRRGLQRTIGGATDLNGDGDSADPGETTNAFETANPRPWSPIGFIQDSLGLANTLIEGDFASQVAGANPALGISGQFLDDVQVDFLIQATQADKRTVQLTAPRLTFTNGQIANIFVVTQQAFVSDLTPVVSDSAVGFDPTVAVASEGVTMLMEGVIAADRRYVTLNVDAGVGRIDGFAQQAVSAVTGGQLVNSRDTQSFIQLPTITVTRVRTTVTVPDEGTVLLGGQRLITELEIETGVPVLSKIPILNRFFTNRISSKEEQTLLILVKPTILITAEQEEKHFPGLMDQLQTGLH